MINTLAYIAYIYSRENYAGENYVTVLLHNTFIDNRAMVGGLDQARMITVYK